MSERVWIVDADSHVTEMPDLWTSRVSKKWGDLVPHVRMSEPGEQGPRTAFFTQGPGLAWYIGDTKIAGAPAGAFLGRKGPDAGPPRTYEDALPATYDGKARLEYMDEAGILAQVLYPNVGGFGSQRFLKLNEPELKLECVRAYNDFLIDWCSPDRRRLIPLAMLPYWDVQESAKEIERVAKIGHRGIAITGAPQSYGFPYLGDRHWDPLWHAAQDCNLPISFHVGSGDFEEGISSEAVAAFGKGAFYTRLCANLFLENANQVTDLILSGILPRFPELKFVSVECGIGWLPFVLETIDYHFNQSKAGKERPEFEMMPSEYYRRQVYICYWFERLAPAHQLQDIGVNNILFETDFPHPTCLYGRETIEQHVNTGLAGQPDDVKRRILIDNSAELYRIPVGEIEEAVGAKVAVA